MEINQALILTVCWLAGLIRSPRDMGHAAKRARVGLVVVTAVR